MSALVLRNAFSDFHGLAEMGAGRLPSADATRRMIFLADRRSEYRRPDHFYKAYVEQRLGMAAHVGDIPWMVLSDLAARYLERREGAVRVRLDRFLEWHELLPFISPLCVVVAFLVAERRGPTADTDPRDYLEAEIGDTALLSPLDVTLRDLIAREGLNEIHMHLNGTTELEVIWHAAVTNPDGFHREIVAAYDESPIAEELYAQMEPGLSPYVVFKRLRAARRVRRLVLEGLRSDDRAGDSVALSSLLEAMSQEASDASVPSVAGLALTIDPSDSLYRHSAHRPIIKEAAWLYAVLQRLSRREGGRSIGTGLYFSLLVLSQIRRLSVQQVDEFGFEQFEKYTKTGTREELERGYLARFRQIGLRPPYDLLAHLEGRFSPKNTEAEGLNQIRRITAEFQTFAGCARAAPGSLPMVPAPCMTVAGCPGPPCSWSGRRLPELSLVGHFIKRRYDPAEDRALQVRDSLLRSTVDRQSRVMKRMLGNGTVRAVLRGVDAAANELNAAPEPFAVAFRAARRAGIDRATFHAGEDFRHLVSGIRYVEEALVFLNLRAGDRIGHATAVGIDPALWAARAGPRALVRRIDFLDDLVFARRSLGATGGFHDQTAGLTALIATHSQSIYGEAFPPHLLEAEWRLRAMDPLRALLVERSAASTDVGELITLARHLSRSRVDEEDEAEYAVIAAALEIDGAAFGIFRRRHALPDERRREWVEVEADLLSESAYVALQERVLAEINLRDVAIEALPTSNLRISFYRGLGEHHIFRWLGLRGPNLTNRPTVLIGSDDPGIFATNLKNEFAAIASVLRTDFNMSHGEVAAVLERLNAGARARRFRPGE